MNNEASVSKIVGSPNEYSWSQASSTGKLYIVISLFSKEEKGGIISTGKESLEQIQREFFALDEKKLTDIKEAVEKVFNSLSPEIDYSAVVATTVEDILYIVTASKGTVLIDRNNNLAEVARGEEGKIIAFSGRIKSDDIIILETDEFNKKISNKLVAEYTGVHNSEKLAEDLAPFILEDSKGREAAVIIHYKNKSHSTIPQAEEAVDEEPPLPPVQEKEPSEDSSYQDNSEDEDSSSSVQILEKLKLKLGSFSKKQRRIFILAGIIVLLLLGSLFAERFMEGRTAALEQFNSVFEASSEKLENAKDLSSLNRGRALEEVNEAIKNIEENLNKFGEGSKEYEQLTTLLNELKSLQQKLGGGSEIAGSLIFEVSDSEILEIISQISGNENGLIVASNNGYAVISEDGDIQSEEEIDLNIKDMISDDTYLYVLSDSVSRITISNGNSVEIIEGSGDKIDISYFGSNIYLLSSGEDPVTRYSGGSYQEANYLSGGQSINGAPISFAIDSSVYILTDRGVVEKFTRGEKDNDFELDSSLSISKNALLYSNENLSNFYLLDKDNASLSVLDPDGSVTKKFNSLDFQNAKSFTVNNSESKVFVVIDEQVYSYDL